VSGEQRHNIELKARCPDRERAEKVCERLKASCEHVEVQTDTYFSMGAYRMKLRESSLGQHWIIWYHRANRGGSRKSSYRLFSVTDPDEKKRMFANQMGVKTVVEKERTLYMFENVRIHLDRVAGLGDFLEFEAVLADESESGAGHEKIAKLRDAFGINEEDLISGSYSDLVSAIPARR
jgi:predicted adenylyl cyclase CyaB